MAQKKLDTVQDFVFQGFQSRYQQVFQTMGVWSSSADQIKGIEKAQEGKRVEYPYAFFRLSSMSRNPEGFNSHYLARHGFTFSVETDGNVGKRMKLLPTNFETEIEFVTNRFDKSDTSVTTYISRWLMASRLGHLKFNIRYGRVSLGINVELADNVSPTVRENPTEAETSYRITSTATIKGYISEALVQEQQIVKNVEALGLLTELGGRVASSQFFPIDRSLTDN